VTWDLWVGLAFFVGYLTWGTPAWGKTFDLGNMPEINRKGEPLSDWLARVLDYSPAVEDRLCFVLRQCYIFPCIGLLVWLAGLPWTRGLYLVVMFPLIAEICYEVGWKRHNKAKTTLTPSR
jgi:hypothetical protein